MIYGIDEKAQTTWQALNEEAQAQALRYEGLTTFLAVVRLRWADSDAAMKRASADVVDTALTGFDSGEDRLAFDISHVFNDYGDEPTRRLAFQHAQAVGESRRKMIWRFSERHSATIAGGEQIRQTQFDCAAHANTWRSLANASVAALDHVLRSASLSPELRTSPGLRSAPGISSDRDERILAHLAQDDLTGWIDGFRGPRTVAELVLEAIPGETNAKRLLDACEAPNAGLRSVYESFNRSALEVIERRLEPRTEPPLIIGC